VCSGSWRPPVLTARADFSPSPQLVGPNYGANEENRKHNKKHRDGYS